MRVRNYAISLIFIAFLVILNGCDTMDTFLPSSNSYKLNARVVNGDSFDECSFIAVNDSIQPFFENFSTSSDPDITALMVFFKNSIGEIVGKKFLYSLTNEAVQDEQLIPVERLDNKLPPVQMPPNSPVGRYIMVYQLMKGREILQKTEKPFYYMGGTNFYYDISVHLPGVTNDYKSISLGVEILLEAKIDFNGMADPYIVWYSGSKKISEGKYSNGANFLLWKAPAQSGFYPVSAEIFPSESHAGLSGYKKEVSLVVSGTKTMELNLVSDKIPQLVHWYTFEGNLNDSLSASSRGRSLKTLSNTKHQWLPANGTYGLAAGLDRNYDFPAVSGYGNWQTLFRFYPINDGDLFYVRFAPDVFMDLSIKGKDLVLTLSSPSKTVSQTLSLQKLNTFVTAGVSFSVLRGSLAAGINITGDERNELNREPLRLDVNTGGNFQIVLGNIKDENTPILSTPVFTAIWDEFALYNNPPVENILTDVIRTAGITASRTSYVSNN